MCWGQLGNLSKKAAMYELTTTVVNMSTFAYLAAITLHKQEYTDVFECASVQRTALHSLGHTTL